MNTNKLLRDQLTTLMQGGDAFTPLEQVLDDIPFDKLGNVPDGLPYSIWQLTEHIRITQADIYDFSTNPNYQSRNWPDDYWPEKSLPENAAEWEATVDAIFRDRQRMIVLVTDAKNDLFTPFAHGSGQNLLREAMLVAEHTAYHTGQSYWCGGY